MHLNSRRQILVAMTVFLLLFFFTIEPRYCPGCRCHSVRRIHPSGPWRLPGATCLISSCLFVPSVLRWPLPWSSCPGSWPGLWGRWGCWWERRGTKRSGIPAGLSGEAAWPGVEPSLAGEQSDAWIGAETSTWRCDLVRRSPSCSSECLHRVWLERDCPSGCGCTRAAAEPGRNKHAHLSWWKLSASREGEQKKEKKYGFIHPKLGKFTNRPT